MNQFDVEEKLNLAFEHAVPDVKDKILQRCENATSETDRVIPMSFEHKKVRKTYHLQSIIAVAALLLLILNVGMSWSRTRLEQEEKTIISLDVNPSIELAINAENRVIKATPINEDARIVLDGMNLSGSTTEVAVNAVLGAMLKHGYLNENSNSILVSVDNQDEEECKQIETALVEDINETVQSYSMDVAILSQSVASDEVISQTASEYEISQGRALLIQKIIDNNPCYTFEELSQLTINELNLLLSSERIEVQSVTTTGEASVKSYIGQDASVETVQLMFQGNWDVISDLFVDIDVLNARMVYRVCFLYEGMIYSYDVDALTGEIVASDMDYPVVEVPENVDITGADTGNYPTDSSSEAEGQQGDNGQSSGDNANGNPESGQNTGDGQDSSSDNANGTSVSDNSVSGNSVSQNSVSSNSVSSNSVSANNVSSNNVPGNTDDGENGIAAFRESKYYRIFASKTGIPTGARILWEDLTENSGEYLAEWVSDSRIRTMVLTHAQITDRSTVTYSLAAVYELDGESYYILEFATETHVYQYLLNVMDGTILEYEKRML